MGTCSNSVDVSGKDNAVDGTEPLRLTHGASPAV